MIVEEAAKSNSFAFMQGKFVSMQKGKFFELKRQFAARVGKRVFANTLYTGGPTINAALESVKYEDVIPSEFRS